MSIQWMNRVWQSAPVQGNLLLLLLKLADNANEDGVCFPGRSYLARSCRVSERTIPRLVQYLEVAGQIAVRRQVGRSNRNRYYLLIGRADTEKSRILAFCGYSPEGIAQILQPGHPSPYTVPDPSPDDDTCSPSTQVMLLAADVQTVSQCHVAWKILAPDVGQEPAALPH